MCAIPPTTVTSPSHRGKYVDNCASGLRCWLQGRGTEMLPVGLPIMGAGVAFIRESMERFYEHSEVTWLRCGYLRGRFHTRRL
jgi:hypothetical protein